VDILTNLHAMVVHFPIALLITSVVLQAASLHPKLTASMRPAALFSLVLGTIGAAASVLTGPEDNARGITNLVRVHERWAQLTTLLFIALTVIQMWSAWRRKRQSAAQAVALLVVSAIGLGMLAYTGLVGGQMVYEQAIGVRRDGQLIVQPKAGFGRN